MKTIQVSIQSTSLAFSQVLDGEEMKKKERKEHGFGFVAGNDRMKHNLGSFRTL